MRLAVRATALTVASVTKVVSGFELTTAPAGEAAPRATTADSATTAARGQRILRVAMRFPPRRGTYTSERCGCKRYNDWRRERKQGRRRCGRGCGRGSDVCGRVRG